MAVAGSSRRTFDGFQDELGAGIQDLRLNFVQQKQHPTGDRTIATPRSARTGTPRSARAGTPRSARTGTPRSARTGASSAPRDESLNSSYNIVQNLRNSIRLFCNRVAVESGLFGLEQLSKSPLSYVAKVWHTFGLWAASCIILTFTMNLLLRFYIDWFSHVQNMSSKANLKDLTDFPYAPFFAIFLRSWMLVQLSGDIIRFCYRLCLDSWEVDSFGAYRRSISCLGHAGMVVVGEDGRCHLSHTWPETILTSHRRLLDKACQFLIHFTLDVAPVFHGLLSFKMYGPEKGCNSLLSMLAMMSLVHVHIFYIFWTLNDVWLKVLAWKRCAATAGSMEGNTITDEGQPAVHLSPRAMMGYGADSVADKLNISLPCCRIAHGFYRAVLYHSGWAVLVVLGVYSGAVSLLFLVAFGIMMLLIWVRADGYRRRQSSNFVRPATVGQRSSREYFKGIEEWFQRNVGNPWLLEDWGRHYCSLDHDSQTSSQFVFAFVVVLQGMLFLALGKTPGLIVCFSLLLLVVVRFESLGRLPPLGWLAGCFEGFAVTFFTAFLNIHDGWTLKALLVGGLRQFGLARRHHEGRAVVSVVTSVMHLLLVIAVALVLQLTNSEGGGEYTHTFMCDPSEPGCIYYPVPAMGPARSRRAECQMGLPLTDHATSFLSLGDLGLFSLIAYESTATIDKALKHFFPGWKLVYSHIAAHTESSQDWTTFFEFTDPSHSTSVFSIRGTSDTLDCLNDVNVFMPAAIMQLYGMVGPALPMPMAKIIASMSKTSGTQKNYFPELLEYVETRLAMKDRQQFIITGHSLGGGLAKLVASKTGIPAVTFMAPGISLTSYIVFGEGGNLHNSNGSDMLTVMPDYDIVSRVDIQASHVASIGCAHQNPAKCHSMLDGLCMIFSGCGSGRPQDGHQVSLPCGCPSMPCPT